MSLPESIETMGRWVGGNRGQEAVRYWVDAKDVEGRPLTNCPPPLFHSLSLNTRGQDERRRMEEDGEERRREKIERRAHKRGRKEREETTNIYKKKE